MDKEKIVERAMALKASGKYNCAQAVACAFAPETGLDEDTLYNAGNAFGIGMGCMEATCGALTGAGMVIGMVSRDRVKAMKTMAPIVESFRKRNGATICKDLKGIATGKPLRPCQLCVADAAGFLADTLSGQSGLK